MISFVFHFHKKMEYKIQFVFRFSFLWTNYLNRSRLTLWIFSQVWSSRYSKASLCQIPWDFPLYNGHTDAKNLLFRKQLMYFNVYITDCYFHIVLFLQSILMWNILTEAAITRCSPKVAPKVIYKLFTNRKKLI